MARSVVLVNPPDPPGATSTKEFMGGFGEIIWMRGVAFNIIPPLDIPYTAALLRQNGIPVKVIDCQAEGYEREQLIETLERLRPDIIGLRTATPTISWDIGTAEVIDGALSRSSIVFFGPHVTQCPGEALASPAIDAVILGEPEATFVDLASSGFKGTKGVWFKEDGAIFKNPEREAISDLDALPFPAWDLMPYHRYGMGALIREERPFFTILTSRGCPFDCAYCPYPVAQGRRWRYRSPPNVVAEMEHLVQRYGMRGALIRDPEFTLNKKRARAICEGIIAKGLPFKWRCETGVESLDEDLIAIMAQAGCIGMNIGVETSSPEVLHAVDRRRISEGEFRGVIEACHKHHIDTYAFFVLGLPGDTKDGALETIAFARRLGATTTQFTIATPYPGTRMRQWALERGFIENHSWEALSGWGPVMRNEALTTTQLAKLQRLANLSLDLDHSGLRSEGLARGLRKWGRKTLLELEVRYLW